MSMVAHGLTAAQQDLLSVLIAEAAQGSADLEWRWKKAAPFVRDFAKTGRLVLVRDWTVSIVISPAGDVAVVDTEDGAPDRPATSAERRHALFRAIRHYPELVSLLPGRPANARTCTDCHGTGILVEVLRNPVLRDLVCSCGGAGWHPEE